MTTRTGSPHVPVEEDYTEAEYLEAEAENDGIEWSDEDLDGPQGVVAPLNTIAPEDVEAGQNAFDQWLRENSDGWVTLPRIKAAAGAVPVLGNLMALVDAIGDITTLVDSNPTQFLDWVSLGINLFGVVPVPGTAAARMSLRPALFLVQKEVARQAKAGLGNAIIMALAAHLSENIAGDIEDFAQQAQARLEGLLRDAGAKAEEIIRALADVLVSLTVPANADASFEKAGAQLSSAWDKKWDSPLGAARDLWDGLGSGVRGSKQSVGNAAKDLLPGKARDLMLRSAQRLNALAPQVNDSMQSLADENNVNSIASLLMQLSVAVVLWRQRKGYAIGANVRPAVASKARQMARSMRLARIRRQARARRNANPDKNGACPATCHSISFAMGTERITHGDFSLPGPFPLHWARTYSSDLAAFDRGPLGARWINEYTTRIDIKTEGADRETLRYHAADGRTHAWPLPAVGKFHYDPVENLTVVRTSDTELTVAQGYERRATYQREGRRFRLTGIHLRNGARVALHYRHVVGRRSVLSDLVTYLDDAIHTHVGTQIDDAGRIVALWQLKDGEPQRQLAGYDYDEQGDLLQVRDEHGAQWDYHYRQHLITRYTDRTGRGMNLEWEGSGPKARAIREWADDGSFDTRLRWHPEIRLTYVTDALGNVTEHYYDIDGYTYRIVHPDGLSEWLYRDDAKNVVTHIHPDGNIDSYAYDERSNLLEHLRADGTSVHYAYDDQDQLFKIRDAEGGLWQRDYSPRGYLTETIDPLGNKTEYAYDAAGNPVAIRDARGGQKLLAYNAAGLLTQYTDCSGKRSAWVYDDVGQLTAFTDAAGNITRYGYETGHLAYVTHPDQTIEHFERDAEGRLLAHIDALGRRTQWTYNGAGLLAQRLDAAGGTLQYEWDKLGRLTALANENDRQARFVYDPVGRLLEERGFDDVATRYRYDPDSGTLLSTQDGDRVIEFTFDALGRVTQRLARPYAPSAQAPVQPVAQRSAQTSAQALTRSAQVRVETQTERYSYDGNGRLILAENTACRLQWFHDAAGNLIREHQHYLALAQPVVAVWKHEYDELNQRIATLRPDGHRVNVLTYGSGHVHGLMFDDHELVSIERDDLHREITRTQGNGLAQTQSWDAMGRLNAQNIARGAQRLIHRGYRYDAAGQLEAIQDSRRGPLAYRYDPVGRLLEATSSLGKETFAFDPASNLLDPSSDPAYTSTLGMAGPVYTYRQRSARLDNLLREYAGTHYTYDARGNLVEKVHNGQRSRLEWDLFNRLTGYSNDRLHVSFQYDALGRRLLKQSEAHWRERPGMTPTQRQEEQARANRAMGCSTTLYGWDGDTLAWEGHDDQTTHYLYEPGSFVPLAQAISRKPVLLHQQPVYSGAYDIDQDQLWTTSPDPDPVDAMAWYHCDHLGTPQELTDAQGDIIWSAHYHTWGAAKEAITDAARAAGIRNPIRFQGQYLDPETGLHYNRHRYYDPQIGRFISKDPIGFAGGLNVYRYADNPVGWVDPLGLVGESARRAADVALLGGKAEGAAAELHVGDKIFTGVSGTGRPVHPVVQDALDKVPQKERVPWHGHCAEVDCLSQAHAAGLDPKGGKSQAVNIGSSGKGHGTFKRACSSCANVLGQFGVDHD
ncbi:RHS repeat-associated core domain-containing protein [Achromobacter sp. MFA1 R4]|uniref:RHS repeat-associated core domain-containing protein n=1 Tax=Achromobacter sp. MFA1 R4 TaxID=1881016 RepID=UPI0009537F67|nr:RHS repeat-associated core domain-containing protein [Achromobacter sp. MFA1 R4]SIT16308.1 RHS repeat-associated core domain-containing protein [Achromobacter sp. MFA1 R4]